MCSGSNLALVLLLCGSAAAADLRVCADPANFPFSNRQEQGFENAIARILAQDLGRQLRYQWTPQVGHFLRPLRSGECDVLMGIAADSRDIPVTRPYYRSTYVFLARADAPRRVRSLDDSTLKTARIGVQTPGAEHATSPAAAVLARHGLIRNVAWYPLVRTYVTPDEKDVLVKAVENRDVDVAIAWGPAAGYFTRHASVPIFMAPIAPPRNGPIPTSFGISLGVRPGDPGLLRELNGSLARRARDIRRVLLRFNVPLTPDPPLTLRAR